jgi:hypothetical protein
MTAADAAVLSPEEVRAAVPRPCETLPSATPRASAGISGPGLRIMEPRLAPRMPEMSTLATVMLVSACKRLDDAIASGIVIERGKRAARSAGVLKPRIRLATAVQTSEKMAENADPPTSGNHWRLRSARARYR